MTADDLEAKLQQWKQKFFEVSGREEAQQQYLYLLERTLSRLALVAEGIDPGLDHQLQQLRQQLRAGRDSEKLSQLLEEIQAVIQELEGADSKHTSSAGLICELLQNLPFNNSLQPQARRLLQAVRAAANAHEVSQLYPQLSQLLQQAIKQAEQQRNSFWQRLIPASAGGKLHRDIQSLLLSLLDRFNLPEQFSTALLPIRQRLESKLSSSELPTVINSLADFINDMAREAELQQLEYRAFLGTLTEKINQLDVILLDQANGEAEAFQHRQSLGARLDASLDDMRRDISAEHADAQQLRAMITQRMNSLCVVFDEYRQSDQSRFEASQQQISQLKSQMLALETEAQQLRDGIKQAQESLRKDTLTDIWNRQALMETLEQEYSRWQRYQHPLSLVIWDIDNFKHINDQYGHLAGDKILKEFAKILTESTRSMDFVSRFGGEEFVGLFPDTELQRARLLADKIREQIRESRFLYEGKPVPVSVSAGVSSFREQDTPDLVFKRADSGLYQAKTLGRDNCVAVP